MYRPSGSVTHHRHHLEHPHKSAKVGHSINLGHQHQHPVHQIRIQGLGGYQDQATPWQYEQGGRLSSIPERT
jgi:hypothetical protein